MSHSLLVALGGMAGSVCRFWLSSWVQTTHSGSFPAGTLAVNIVGSFVLGLVMTLSIERQLLSTELRVLFAIGFCGGFTTMSTFSHDTLMLLLNGHTLTALLNVALSFAICLAAVWLGHLAGRAF